MQALLEGFLTYTVSRFDIHAIKTRKLSTIKAMVQKPLMEKKMQLFQC